MAKHIHHLHVLFFLLCEYKLKEKYLAKSVNSWVSSVTQIACQIGKYALEK